MKSSSDASDIDAVEALLRLWWKRRPGESTISSYDLRKWQKLRFPRKVDRSKRKGGRIEINKAYDLLKLQPTATFQKSGQRTFAGTDWYLYHLHHDILRVSNGK